MEQLGSSRSFFPKVICLISATLVTIVKQRLAYNSHLLVAKQRLHCDWSITDNPITVKNNSWAGGVAFYHKRKELFVSQFDCLKRIALPIGAHFVVSFHWWLELVEPNCLVIRLPYKSFTLFVQVKHVSQIGLFKSTLIQTHICKSACYV